MGTVKNLCAFFSSTHMHAHGSASPYTKQVLELPPLQGKIWQQLADTSKLAPYDYLQADEVS